MMWPFSKCCSDCDPEKRKERRAAFDRTAKTHEAARTTLKERRAKLQQYLDEINGGVRPHMVKTVRKGN